MEEKFDVVVVGAGPAGISAAYILAKAGLKVVVFERGKYPGAKNVMGGILYSNVLNQMIPEFWKEAPVERNISKRAFSILSDKGEVSFSFRAEEYNRPPYNNSFTVLRAKFDRWFAKKAEEAGAVLIPETVVDDFLWKEGKVIGVRTRREDGDLRADVVVCAEGANTLLAERAGLKKKSPPEQMVTSVKEVISLPKEVIEDRFQLEGGEGCAFEYFGNVFGGMVGLGFLYTNKDTLSIGLGCSTRDFMRTRITPYDLLEEFKARPSIRPLIKGGEVKEYLAHMIPGGGYNSMPRLVTNGLILVGDAANFVNTTFYHEGSNLAMASGKMAAETIIEAKEKGDFSKTSLSSYEIKIKESFILKDLKKYRKVPQLLEKDSLILKKYPDLLIEMVTRFFQVSGKPKEETQREVLRMLKEKVGLFTFLRDMNKLRRIFV